MGLFDRTFGNKKNDPFGDKKKDLLKVISEFLNASSAIEARQIVEQRPELISAEADSLLNTLFKNTQNEEIRNLIQNRRYFLSLCREVGIARAFEDSLDSSNEISRDDLQIILKKIDSLSRPQDIPKKIIMLQHALSLIQRQSNPQLWASLHVEFGESLANNPQGNRSNNIEQAIEHCNKGLEVYTQEDFPIQWARTQNAMAIAYWNRIRGDKAVNLEKAIEHYNLALKVCTQDDFPANWAMINNNLAIAYNYRILGKSTENIEKAIEHYSLALKVYTKKNFPIDWAAIQNNLAIAYEDRRGDKAENIDKAIEYYNQALEIRTQKDFPVDWAVTQYNLAIAYRTRIMGNRAANIEQAIEHYNLALKVYNQSDYPVDWAATQNNLGTAYWSRIRGDKAENIEKAIEYCNEAFKVRTQKDFPVDWAETQNNLAIAYWSRIRGDKAENIEKAIEHYNKALEIRTQKDLPLYWAETLSNLAGAYKHRIRGDIAGNIELAIEYYIQVLKVYTHTAFPVNWAMTQNNLALAYNDRIQGDKAENIEKAIEYCNEAFKVRTQKDFPVDWAETQNNLAIAYWSRIRGDKAENIEKAIEHYNMALEIRTQKDFPADWAETQNNLALAYWSRIRGDRAENIEQAIEHYIQVLKVYTIKDFPVHWATTQDNLARAYEERIRGDRAENIEKAIEHYFQALAIRTQENLPHDWATTQNNLGTAYWSRIRGDKAENIEKAIEHYNKALEIRTQKDFPVEWASVQNNLAVACKDLNHGDKAENIEEAIEHYNLALKVRTQKSFPVDWAETQYNLALAYKDRILGNKDENIEKVLSHCQNTLQIYKLGSMPIDYYRTCRFLGDLYLDLGQWEKALENYKNAITANDILFRSGLSVESKTVETRMSANVYLNASMVACLLDMNEEALLILEKGKARLLTEALMLNMKTSDFVPKEEWIRYEQAAEKYRIATRFSDRMENYIQRENEIKKALEELDTRVKIVQKYDPMFQKELDIFDILSILDKETALITFLITDKGSIGFEVTSSRGIQSVDIPNFKTKDLNNLLFQLDEKKFINGGWIGNYLHYINALEIEDREEAFESWQNTSNEVLYDIGNKLLYPFLEELSPQIKRLILLPSGGLFLLPLHAVPFSDGQPLCYHYCISYAPSVQLLRELKNKSGITKGKNLYAVINPQEDPSLVFSEFEGQAISQLFESSQVNTGETGTKSTIFNSVIGKAYLHFSCHGSYNWNDPLQSGLHLFGGRTLSLADLQTDVVDMSSARLVTLSACETGITDIMKGNADEFVGLPAGFMLAGVPYVVSSLWSVPDISTALLMEQFYSNHIAKEMDIPMALQEAQLWVRDLKSGQVADYVEKCYQSSKWEGKSKENIERYREHYLKIAEESPDKKPFQHPYYWAAFTVNGT